MEAAMIHSNIADIDIWMDKQEDAHLCIEIEDEDGIRRRLYMTDIELEDILEQVKTLRVLKTGVV